MIRLPSSFYLLFLILALYPFVGYLSYTFLAGARPMWILLVLSIITLLFNLKRRFTFSSFVFVYFIYFVSDIFSKFYINGKALSGESYVFFSIYILISLILFILIENIDLKNFPMDKIKRILRFLIIIAAIISISQFFLGDVFVHPKADIDEEKEGNLRVLSIFSWEGDTKSMMFGTQIFAGIILAGQRTISKFDWLLVLIPVMIVATLTGSRAAIISFFILLFFVFKNAGYTRLILYLPIVVGLGYFILTSLIGFDINDFIENRVQADTTSRYVIYDYAYDMFQKNPLFGDGRSGMKGFEDEFYRNYMFGNKVHNGFLRALINNGIIGLVSFVMLCVIMYKSGKKLARLKRDYSILAMAVIFIWINLTVDINHLLWPCFLIGWLHYNYELRQYELSQESVAREQLIPI